MDHQAVTLDAVYPRRGTRLSPNNRSETMKFTYASGARPLEGFTIQRGVGAGGFGEVYFAVSDAGKEVALKRIQRNLDIELRGVTQCLNLKHPHLLSLFDIRSDDGEAWVVMERIQGESLRDVLKRHPSGLDLPEATAWFEQMIEGVQHLHQQGIVHRDLKPANVFSDQGVVKIGDYGLSKIMSASRHSGHTESIGTFHYMAPEIGRGVYGKEVDIYALGIMLYEMLIGRVPFDGETGQEMIMKHLTELPDLSVIPDRFRGVVAKALNKDPEQRYQSAEAMLAAFRAVERGTANAGAFAQDHEIVFGPVVDATCVSEPPRMATAIPPMQVPLQQPTEPIAKAMLAGVRSGRKWWDELQVPTLLKMALLVAAAILIFANVGWIIPAMTLLGLTYLVYFAVYSLMPVVVPTPQAIPRYPHSNLRTDGVHTRVSPAQKPFPVSHKVRRQQQLTALRAALSRRGSRVHLAELTGSLIEAAFITAVLSLIALIVGSGSVDGSIFSWMGYAWMATVATVGGWTVLVASKYWEFAEGEEIRRRFGMLVLGLALGAFAYALQCFLVTHVSEDVISVVGGRRAQVSGQPALGSFMLFFGLLFATLRWWKQPDPLRNARLRLWDVARCVLLAAAAQWIWPDLHPWGLLIAGTMSISVQLASPWLSQQQRDAMCPIV